MKTSFLMTSVADTRCFVYCAAHRGRTVAGKFLAVLAAFTLISCSDPEPWRLTGQTMGTTYSIVVSRPLPELDIGSLAAAVDDELKSVNAQMSTYLPDSELSRFNQSPSTDWVAVSPQVVQVVAEALEIHRLSDGAFDVTVGPLVDLWGFGPAESRQEAPDEAAIAELLKRVGSEQLEVRQSPAALRKHSAQLRVDLSAIAKGHGVDRVAHLLDKLGVPDYLVEIGGELRAKGTSPRGDRWRIAVEKPSATERAIQQIIAVSGYGVATSGDYRNYFEKDGVRYSHTIDASTGKPITHTLASVTVLRSDASTADALATALMVLGPERGYALAEKSEIPAYFVIKQGGSFVTKYTQGFAPLMVD